MSDQKRLAEVSTIYSSNFRDVAATLRQLADRVETGDLQGTDELVIVAMTPSGLEVFGLGSVDAVNAHYLLCCGAAKLQAPTVRHGDDQ